MRPGEKPENSRREILDLYLSRGLSSEVAPDDDIAALRRGTIGEQQDVAVAVNHKVGDRSDGEVVAKVVNLHTSLVEARTSFPESTDISFLSLSVTTLGAL